MNGRRRPGSTTSHCPRGLSTTRTVSWGATTVAAFNPPRPPVHRRGSADRPRSGAAAPPCQSSPSGGSRRFRRRCRRGNTRGTGSGHASAGLVWNVSIPPNTGRRPSSSLGERGREAARDLGGDLGQIQLAARAGRALDLQAVAVVPVELHQPAEDHRFIGNHTGPRQLELPPNIPVSDSAGR